MEKVIFGVFAHPDDEAFGPSGTLLLETAGGAELHLITLTAGEAGANPDGHVNLPDHRLKEWRKAGSLLGAASMSYLGYRDGSLCNTSMIKIADEIESIIRQRLDQPAGSVEIMSFELGGITGHVDHIVAARAACLVFYRMKPYDRRLKRLRLFCLPCSALPRPDTGWLFMDSGADDNMTEKIDVSSVNDRRIEVIKAHHSQREDGAKHLERCQDTHRRQIDHFIVRT